MRTAAQTLAEIAMAAMSQLHYEHHLREDWNYKIILAAIKAGVAQEKTSGLTDADVSAEGAPKQKERNPISTNAIGHVTGCKCVVCRNTDFDYIKKRKILALFRAVREYTTERQYQNVACRKDQDRLEREMLTALEEAEKSVLSENGGNSHAASVSSPTPSPSSTPQTAGRDEF